MKENKLKSKKTLKRCCKVTLNFFLKRKIVYVENKKNLFMSNKNFTIEHVKLLKLLVFSMYLFKNVGFFFKITQTPGLFSFPVFL